MRFAQFFVKHVWIILETTQYIVESFLASNTGTTMFEMSFFMFLRVQEYLQKKEAPLNFLTDPREGRSTLRPADVMVYGWVGGKHARVDLTGVSPLVGLGTRTFTVGQAALKAASCKVVKHEKACSDNQHAFISFAFDTCRPFTSQSYVIILFLL